MKKIIDLIEDKIREVQNDNGEIQNLELTDEYIKGYTSGLKHAKTIIEENRTKKRLFYDIDENKIITEKDLRKLFFTFEVQDLENNDIDYIEDSLDLESQFNCIRLAKDGRIEEIINRLSCCWNIPIIEINVKEIL